MEEDGEKVDGLTAKLEGDFNRLGLSLYEFGDQLKSPYKILQELSEIYPTLSEGQKAYYTELIARKNKSAGSSAEF